MMKNELNDKIINFLITISMFTFLFNKTCYLPSIIDDIVSYIAIISVVILVILYIVRFKYSKVMIVFELFFMFGVISCYRGQYSDVTTFIKIYYPILGIMLLIDMFISYKAKFIILVLEKVFFTLIFINWVTIVLYPDGLFVDDLYTNNWFLLYDNLHVFIYIPGLIVSMIASEYKKNKIIFYIMLILVIYSVLFCMSATSLVGLGIFILFYIFKGVLNKVKLANATTYFLMYIAVFVGIVFFRMQNLFEFFIVGYLHRDLTFTGRTFLWDKVVEYISLNPILGYGIEYNSIFTSKMGSRLYTHAHNTIYDLLYKGGFVSLTLFIILLLLATKELNKFKDNIISKSLSIGLFALYMMMNFESREDKIGLYVLIILAVNISKIIKSLPKKRQKVI